MELVHEIDRSNITVEEDRISNLPHDAILGILSFLDLKYAVQTCTLSKKWKNIWTSITRLNLNSRMFITKSRFTKFVKHALSHRNNRTKLSTVELAFTGPTTQFFVKDIVNYANLYNVSQLTLIWHSCQHHELPQYLFRSPTLKHLTLNYAHSSGNSNIPISAWDFPALETLNLSNMCLVGGGDKSVSLFSKCVNLKDLTLHGLQMHKLEIFTVCAPQLLNLTITDSVTFPKVFEVVAPQLKNLVACVNKHPNAFAMFQTMFLPLSTKGFNSLEKVNLSSEPSGFKFRHGDRLLDLFQILHSAKSLILDVKIVKALSSHLGRLAHEPCPFNKLKFLKINMMTKKQNGRIPTIPLKVRNYLLESSRSATFIMDFPQVPQKRSREEIPDDTVFKKMAKLQEEKQMQDEVIVEQKAKIQMQDEDIAKQKRMLEELEFKYEKLMSHMTEYKMEELAALVESKNLNYEVIRAMGYDIKSVMEMIPEGLRVAVKARLCSLFEGMKSLLLNHIDDSQWQVLKLSWGI